MQQGGDTSVTQIAGQDDIWSSVKASQCNL